MYYWVYRANHNIIIRLTSFSFKRSDQNTGLECDGLLDGGHTIVDTLVVVPHAERPVHDRRGGRARADGGGRRKRLDENRRRLSEMGRAGRETGILVHGGTGRWAVVGLVGRSVGRRRLLAARSIGTDERGTRPAISGPGRRGRDVPVSVHHELVGGRNVPAKQCRRGGERWTRKGATQKNVKNCLKRRFQN